VRLEPRALALGGLAVVVAAAAAVVLSGGAPSARRVEELFVESGPWGPVVFVVSIVLVQPLGVPGIVWMAPAGLIWPIPVAIALSWLGNMGASSVGFAFARWMGRDWVAARIPPRLVALDTRLGHRGVAPVVGLRILTGGLAPADWLLGLSSVRWRTFLAGTAIGMVPGVTMAVVAGGGVLGWALDQPPWLLGVLGVLAVMGLAALVVLRHRLDAVARSLRARVEAAARADRT
jgi:uncharacterized membrane protein YdjX (TVP38/TMEM64 family)